MSISKENGHTHMPKNIHAHKYTYTYTYTGIEGVGGGGGRDMRCIIPLGEYCYKCVLILYRVRALMHMVGLGWW
jgi:hypothetical protein